MAGQTLSIPRSLGALFDIGVVGDLSDGQLLERFTTGHREAAELAFHSLVERHGPMVLRVCRRLLDDPNDAEDAFQATFLVLLRRAGAIRDRGSVAAWLHGVARGSRRAPGSSRPAADGSSARASGRRSARNDDPDRLDLETLIDEELARLPEKYRQPVVLCYLEGLTHEGAAARLGWPVGTVRGRLSRARDLLRSRLTRRGVTASAAIAAIGSLERSGEGRRAGRAARGRPSEPPPRSPRARWSPRWPPPGSRRGSKGRRRGLVFCRFKTAAGVLLLLGTVGYGPGDARAAPSSPPTRRPSAPHRPTRARRSVARCSSSRGHGRATQTAGVRSSTACPSRRRRSR